MTTINGSPGINQNFTRLADTVKWERPTGEKKEWLDALWEQVKRGGEVPDNGQVAANDPSNLWGEIKKDGEVMARIYKGGVAEFSEKYMMQFTSDNPADRASEFMKRFGGSLYLSGPSKDLFSM